MKNKKILILASSIALALGTAVFALSNGGSSFSRTRADCAHEHVEHYKVYPTTSDGGRIEHWACCDCGEAWYDEEKTRPVADRSDLDIPHSTAAVEVDKNEVAIDDILTIYSESNKTKGLDQTNWGPEGTAVKSTGTFKYYEVDGRRALKVSATGLTDAQRLLVKNCDNGGFGEWRFQKTVTTDTVTFDYKFYDVNTKIYNDGANQYHSRAQFYDGSVYHEAVMDLVNDNAWHSMTVTADQAYAMTYFVMKVYAYDGELYISNLVIGDTPTVNCTTNRYGAALYNGASDVGEWGGGYNGGNKLNRYGATSIAYSYYGWGLFQAHLPRINYSNYSEVTFTLGHTKATGSDGTAAADPSGNPAGFRIGFGTAEGDMTVFAASWEAGEITNGKLTIIPFAGKLLVQISSFSAAPDIRAEITDNEVIHGTKSLVLTLGGYLNDSTSYALLLTNISLATSGGMFNMAKVAECAGNDTFTDQNLNAPLGFNNVFDRTGVGSGQTFYFKDINISSYNTLVFGIYLNSSHLYVFSGDNSKSINIWGPRWVFVKLQKNQSGKWDSYYKEYHMLNGDWTARIGDLDYSNLNQFVTVNWDGIPDAKLGMTELYAM